MGFDITDRRQAQEQMARERDLLQTLIDHVPDYIFVKDIDGRFVNSNAAHNQVAQVKHADELSAKLPLTCFRQLWLHNIRRMTKWFCKADKRW